MSAPTTPALGSEAAEKAPKAVVRQSGITSIVAMLGVLSGLLLDLSAVGVMGAIGARSDAWVVALRLPLAVTAIAMVVANQVLVPTFAAWATRLRAWERTGATSAILVATGIATVVLAGLMSAFARPLISVIAPDFTSGEIDMAASMTRIIAWYIPFVLMAEVLRSWLNAHLVVGFPAAMTLVLNLSAVAFIIAFAQHRPLMVPTAYVAGSLVQVVAMAVMAFFKGWRPAAPMMRHPEVAATARLLVRPSGAAALNPVVRTLEAALATFLPTGSNTLLHFGNRLAAAVGGTIVFRSIMVSVLPRISRAFGRGDTGQFRMMTRLGMRLMFLLAVPMTMLGVVLAPALTEAVFSIVPKFNGPGQAGKLHTLGILLALYSLSFVGAGVQRSLLAPFYAMRDTRTPLRNTVYATVANVALLLLGFALLKDHPNAIYIFPIAYSLAQCVNVAHAWWRMRTVPGLERMPLLIPLAGSLVAGGVGALVAWLILRFAPATPELLAPMLATLAGLGVAFGLGVLAFRRGSRGTGTGAAQFADRSMPSDQTPSDQIPSAQIPSAQTLVAREQEELPVTTTDEQVVGAPQPPTRRSVFDVQRYGTLGTILTALLGIALTVLTVVEVYNGTSRLTVALPIALLVGIALLMVAFYDLETFVLVALTMRASLDALRTPGAAPDPHILLGLLLLGLGTVWLLSRRAHLGRRFPMSALGVAYLIFLAVAFIGVITSASAGTAITEWSRIANIVVVFLVVEQFAARGSALFPFVAAIALSILVPAAVALVQLSSGEGLFVAGGYSRITGTFDHSNPLAYFSCVVLVLMVAVFPRVKDLTRVAVGSVAVIAVILLGLTYTRSAWLVAALAVFLLLLRRKSYGALAVLAALLMLGISTPQVQGRFADLETSAQLSGKPANSLAWRWAYWGEALDVAKPSPIAGVGLRGVAQTTAEGKQPHNDIVRAYVELGIPGLLSYVFVLALMVWTTARAARDAARRRLGGVERAIAEAAYITAISLVLLSLVANLMSQVVVTVYAVTVIALASGTYLRRRRLDAEADAAADLRARSARVART